MPVRERKPRGWGWGCEMQGRVGLGKGVGDVVLTSAELDGDV